MARKKKEPKGPRIMWNTWINWFKPEPHRDGQEHGLCTGDECYMYETYDRDEEYVRAIAEKEPGRVWTYLDADGKLILVSGWHYVNRMGYAITEVAVTGDKYYEVIDS